MISAIRAVIIGIVSLRCYCSTTRAMNNISRKRPICMCAIVIKNILRNDIIHTIQLISPSYMSTRDTYCVTGLLCCVLVRYTYCKAYLGKVLIKYGVLATVFM